MGLFDGIEKLINEHGSSVILKERLAYAADQFVLLTQQHAMLKEEHAAVKAENAALKAENAALKTATKNHQIKEEQVEQQVKHLKGLVEAAHSGNPDGYVCDHCGSPSLKRTGSRPDPTFSDFGIKQQIFTCNSCGKESAFTKLP